MTAPLRMVASSMPFNAFAVSYIDLNALKPAKTSPVI